MQTDCQPPAVVHADAMLGVLANQLGMGFWRVLVANGAVYWSEQVFEIYGLPVQAEPLTMEEAIGHVVEYDRPMAVALLKRSVAEKHGQKVIFRIETGAGIKLIECTGDVRIGPGGEVSEVFGTMQDITGRSMKDANAVGRSLLVRTLMKNVPAAIAVLDRDMNYLAVSDYWIAGHKTSEGSKLIGKNHYAVRPDISAEHRAEHKRVLAGETIHSPRAYMKDATGKIVPQMCVMCPWHKVDGTIGGMMLMLGAFDTPVALAPAGPTLRPTRHELLEILQDL
ncbi:PAS domain-containing protein [Devosia sp.]|uniref:PAS domain-containing protein n=1 Tax=Devosia sp. TaxID=1871048 RepID=UPI002FC909C6